jgi:hypothetical protein
VIEVSGRPEIDLVRTEPEDFTELAHLHDLWQAASAFPEVDGLRLDPNGESQLELGPPPFLPKGTNRLHVPSSLRFIICTITCYLLQDNYVVPYIQSFSWESVAYDVPAECGRRGAAGLRDREKRDSVLGPSFDQLRAGRRVSFDEEPDTRDATRRPAVNVKPVAGGGHDAATRHHAGVERNRNHLVQRGVLSSALKCVEAEDERIDRPHSK